MRRLMFTAAVLLFAGFFAFAGRTAEKEEALPAFLEGSYDVIGRYPDGGKTYCGIMTLERKGDRLSMTRVVGGRTSTGSAAIVTITADAIAVLQADFVAGGQRLRATYTIGSDADNYARLTGKVYTVERKTRVPGLEALFMRHPTE